MTSSYPRAVTRHAQTHHPQGEDPLEGYPNDTLFAAVLERVTALEALVVDLGTLVDDSIHIFRGAVIDIPSGWQLCDGTNGTPDLRGQFIIGSDDGTFVGPGSTGGSATQGNHTTPDPHSAVDLAAVLEHQHQVSLPAHSVAQVVDTGGNDAGWAFSSEAAAAHPNDNTENLQWTTAILPGLAHQAISAHGTNLPPYYAFALIARPA